MQGKALETPLRASTVTSWPQCCKNGLDGARGDAYLLEHMRHGLVPAVLDSSRPSSKRPSGAFPDNGTSCRRCCCGSFSNWSPGGCRNRRRSGAMPEQISWQTQAPP